MGRKPVDLTDQVFGKLTVLKVTTDKASNGSSIWLCRCSCDNKIVTAIAGDLKSGHKKSCGCYKAEKAVKHGKQCKNSSQIDKLVYRLWRNIKTRCYNENYRRYKDYGGRGIRMYPNWKDDFISFYSYVTQLPNYPTEKIYKARLSDRINLSIDRCNNEEGYFPGNIKWATKEVQANNCRSNKLVTYKGATLTLAEMVRLHAVVNYHTVKSRLNKFGWSVEKALTTPSRKNNKRRLIRFTRKANND